MAFRALPERSAQLDTAPDEAVMLLDAAASSQSANELPVMIDAGYGIAEAELEAGPVPLALVAVTVTLYVLPLVSPVIVQLVVAEVQVDPPVAVAV